MKTVRVTVNREKRQVTGQKEVFATLIPTKDWKPFHRQPNLKVSSQQNVQPS